MTECVSWWRKKERGLRFVKERRKYEKGGKVEGELERNREKVKKE